MASAMYEPSRHVPLTRRPWDPAAARAAVGEIIDDAVAAFDAARFWPAHPLDEGMREGSTTLYAGAAGTIWALDYLHRAGLARAIPDFRPILARLLEENRREYGAFGWYPAHASLLMGEVGVLLLAMRIAPSAATAAQLERRALDNIELPALELMWGMPGTMLAALFMARMNGEAPWRAVFRRQAERMLGELQEGAGGTLWIGELYGSRGAYLGPVHGFAGQMLPLLRGWDWLGAAERERVASAIARTLCATAWESDNAANWHALADERSAPYLVQHCHGAPGMITSFADSPFPSAALDRLLPRAGELVWRAGPLRKGSNLCHGTAGNGYALLKLYSRTGEPVWLERARAFVMSAIAQCRDARRSYRQGRYSLWTGDLGLAVYLYDCLRAKACFPTIDVF